MKTSGPLRFYRNSTSYALPGGVLSLNTTDIVVTTPAADLMSYSIPAEFLSNVGDRIKWTAWFQASGTTDIAVTLDGTNLFVQNGVAFNVPLTIEGEFIVTSAGTVKSFVTLVNSKAGFEIIQGYTVGVTFTGPATLLFNGKNITQYYLAVDWTPGS